MLNHLMKTRMTALVVGALATGSCLADAPIVLKPGENWRSQPFAVTGGGQYELDFSARIVGKTTLEQNRLVGQAFYDIGRETKGMPLPTWTLEFHDANGRKVPDGISTPYWKTIYSGTRTTYRDGFNCPWKATEVVLCVSNRSKHDMLELEPATLVKSKSPYVNVNADFDMGEHCHAGWGRGGAGALLKMEPRPDGRGHYMSIKTFFNIDSVPVREGHTYAFDIELRKGVRFGTACKVFFIDDKGSIIPNAGGTVAARAAKGGCKVELVAPKGARSLMLKGEKTDFVHFRISDKGVRK